MGYGRLGFCNDTVGRGFRHPRPLGFGGIQALKTLGEKCSHNMDF